MNWLDIVLVVAIAISAVTGLRIGLIKSILSIIGMIAGVILAGRYYVLFSERLSFIPQETLARIVAFLIILVAVMVIANILAWLLDRFVSAIMLGWVNHLGGAVFGLFLGIIFCSALLTIWVRLVGINVVIGESRIASVLLDYFSLILGLLPRGFDSASPFF